MFDLFLVSDQQLFELAVRGSLTSPGAATALVEAIGHLPREADLLVDLTEIDRVDLAACAELRTAILGRRVAGGTVAIVTPDLDVRATLAAGDIHHVAALAASRREAVRLLPGQLVA